MESQRNETFRTKDYLVRNQSFNDKLSTYIKVVVKVP